jgi:aminoglycoside phosphotransferase (APT) family kinase protein
VRVADAVERARAATATDDASASGLGLERLQGGMSHAVFSPMEDPALVVKVFRTSVRQEPEREWEALVALAGSGVAPEPVHFDAGDPAVVVMTRVRGSSRPADELSETDAAILGRAHRQVHGRGPKARRPLSHGGVRAACASLRHGLGASGENEEPAVLVAAWTAARAWVGEVDVEGILTPRTHCFSRGDPNLTNYLWSDDGVVALVDWEDSGGSDPVLELADLAEHASSRALTDRFWDALADATGLRASDRPRVTSARRVMACFWLVLITTRSREHQPTTVTLEEQARRTLAVLGH